MKYVAIAALALLACCRTAQASEESYWVFLRSDDRTWCGYDNVESFQAEAAEELPTDSARATFLGSQLSEITYQVSPESGDWMVIDKYVPNNSNLELLRAVLLVQENRKIVQQASIINGALSPFVIVEDTTLDGKSLGSTTADMPDVAVFNDLSQFPFLRIVQAMHEQSLAFVCQKSSVSGQQSIE